MATSMKTMLEFVVDVGATMDDSVAEGSKLSIAKHFISSFVIRRMIASKTAEFGVASFGADATRNYLARTQGGYEHVEEIVKMDKASVDMVRAVEGMRVGHGVRDLINGIVVAQDVLMRVNAGKAFNRIMVILTDGEMEVEGVEDLETIVAQMKTVPNFGLYIAMLSSDTDNKPSSLIKTENEKLLRSVASAVNGGFMVVRSISDCYQLLSGAPGVSTRPQLTKITLELTPQLRIPCVQFSLVMKASAPSLVRQVAGGRSDSVVKRDTTYRNPLDLDELVPDEMKVKGYRYGDQFIPMTADDEAMLKVEGPAALTLIGTMPAAKVPRHHLLEGAVVLQGAPNITAAHLALTALSRAMKDADCALLVRCAKRENADPFLGVLLHASSTANGTGGICCSTADASVVEPCDDEHTLLLHRLPTIEDVRDYAFASLIQFADIIPTETNSSISSSNSSNSNNSTADAQRVQSLKRKASAMSSFVDAMTVAAPSRELLMPMNPYLQGIFQELRCIIAEQEQHGPANAVSAALSSDGALQLLRQRAVAAAEHLYEAFPLERVEKSRRKKKKEYWSELDIKVTPGLL